MATSEPESVMVSCLTVTLPVSRRFLFLRRSVADYCRQTHPNREMVIVIDQGTVAEKSAIASFISSLGRNDIRIVDLQDKLSLGRLLNVSRESAKGDVTCIWDDDDFHHPQRLERQLKALIESGGQAVYLQEVMQFFPDSRTLYYLNWRATEAKSHPGTLMCRRSAPILYPENRPPSTPDVDLAVCLQLQQQSGFHVLAGEPHLFVYVSHGANAWAGDHHRMLARELSISQGLLRRREAQLREGLRPFDFGPGEITVQGYNGTAFILGADPPA
jgi:glycosyltransferase involved in cell wall biosynthesis